VTACDVVRRPYRGHEAAIEDSISKRGGGVCGPPMALGRMNQLKYRQRIVVFGSNKHFYIMEKTRVELSLSLL
jgi:hypothetical protein